MEGDGASGAGPRPPGGTSAEGDWVGGAVSAGSVSMLDSSPVELLLLPSTTTIVCADSVRVPQLFFALSEK